MSVRSLVLALPVVLSVWAFGCGDNAASPLSQVDDSSDPVDEDVSQDDAMDPTSVPESLTANFEPLPEALVAVSADSTVFAQYAQPTDRYGHGILGDRIEAGQLVVWRRGTTFTYTLDTQHVFEDLAPRLVDVDGDGELEFVTIRTHVLKGAGIAIYRIDGDSLVEYARVKEIGTPSRWLNVAAIYDLDSDGMMEIAWVQTPHIGGILRVARMSQGELEVLAESTLYSNHAIGERNLCLSVVSDEGGQPVLYVPSHDRSQIVGLTLSEDAFVRVRSIDQDVDFSIPLHRQGDFGVIVQGGEDCKNGVWPEAVQR